MDALITPLPSSREQQQAMNKLLAGQFCFVQVENGHVMEVFYEEGSNPEGVNLKKSIAAAFQANFQNQEEEEEEDPQSVHMAHYRYYNNIVQYHEDALHCINLLVCYFTDECKQIPLQL